MNMMAAPVEWEELTLGHPARAIALVVYGSFARRLVGVGYPWGKSPEAHAAYAMQVESDCGRQADMHVMRPSADDAMAWS